jgi:hypothetical protein
VGDKVRKGAEERKFEEERELEREDNEMKMKQRSTLLHVVSVPALFTPQKLTN